MSPTGHRNISDWLYKRRYEKSVNIKVPEPAPHTRTEASRLLEIRREMTEVDYTLNAGKKEFDKRMSGYQERREQLETKERVVHDYLRQYEKYVQDIEAKKIRAVKTEREQRAQRRRRTRELDLLHVENRELVAVKEQFKGKADKIESCKTYLEKVVDASNDFGHPMDIMGRYETLKSTLDALREGILEKQNLLGEMKYSLMKYTDEKSYEIMGYNNQLSKMTTRYDKVKRSTAILDTKWNHIKNTAAAKVLLIGRIKMATHNIYEVVRHRQGHAKSVVAEESQDTLEQLTKIAFYVRDLSDTVADLHRGLIDETTSTRTCDSDNITAVSRLSFLRTQGY